MTKFVQIQIDQAAYNNFRTGKFNLCFALKTNDTYSVICQSTFDYLPSTRISWSSTYQLFGTNFFIAGADVVVETNPVDIEFGQRARLNSAGVLKPAEDVGSSGVITFVNDYGAIHPGLIAPSAGPDGIARQLPIHLERQVSNSGFVWLTPADMAMIWFQQNVTTGMMLDPDLTRLQNAIEVDLTDTDTVSLQFESNAWMTNN